MTATKPLPKHIQKHLIATGVLTNDGLGRKAQLRQCTACHGWVLVGLDSHRCALRVVCDPVAIDKLGEAWAWLNGRRTYELWGTELERRDKFSIRGGMKKPVLSEHECGVKKTPSPQILALFMKPVTTTSDCEVPF